jgi:hypothetical protein
MNNFLICYCKKCVELNKFQHQYYLFLKEKNLLSLNDENFCLKEIKKINNFNNMNNFHQQPKECCLFFTDYQRNNNLFCKQEYNCDQSKNFSYQNNWKIIKNLYQNQQKKNNQFNHDKNVEENEEFWKLNYQKLESKLEKAFQEKEKYKK